MILRRIFNLDEFIKLSGPKTINMQCSKLQDYLTCNVLNFYITKWQFEKTVKSKHTNMQTQAGQNQVKQTRTCNNASESTSINPFSNLLPCITSRETRLSFNSTPHDWWFFTGYFLLLFVFCQKCVSKLANVIQLWILCNVQDLYIENLNAYWDEFVEYINVEMTSVVTCCEISSQSSQSSAWQVYKSFYL